MSRADRKDRAPTAGQPRERSLNSSLSIVGGVRSSLALSGAGLTVLRGAARSLSQGTRRALQPGRNETFAAAMARLGIAEADLPLVHNQLTLSVYAVLLVALVALGATVHYIVAGQVMPTLACVIVGLACLGFAAQASYRTSCVRRRELGNWNEWLAHPRQWLPSRLDGLRAMNVGDPVLEPAALNARAKLARSRLWIALGFAVLTVLSLLTAPVTSFASGSTIFGLAAAAALLFSIQASFTVFRAREQTYYDVLAWLIRPSAWIPAHYGAQDLAQRERALARQRHAQRVAARAARADDAPEHGGEHDKERG